MAIIYTTCRGGMVSGLCLYGLLEMEAGMMTRVQLMVMPLAYTPSLWALPVRREKPLTSMSIAVERWQSPSLTIPIASHRWYVSMDTTLGIDSRPFPHFAGFYFTSEQVHYLFYRNKRLCTTSCWCCSSYARIKVSWSFSRMNTVLLFVHALK